jgi:hypothetical protein
MLQRYIRNRMLVKVSPDSRTYYLKGVPARYSYIRPWSKRFLDQLSSQYHAKFNDRLRVTSLVRTSKLQMQLAGYNTNAAPASGKTMSSHLTGATLDISHAKMTAEQKQWMRSKLLSLSGSGFLYGIEERVQPTFHIMVYKHFPGATKAQRHDRTTLATETDAEDVAEAVDETDISDVIPMAEKPVKIVRVGVRGRKLSHVSKASKLRKSVRVKHQKVRRTSAHHRRRA